MTISANAGKFYINGAWVEPSTNATLPVVNPADNAEIGAIALGGEADVDAAVAAARAAFETYSQTSVEERIELLNRIVEVYGNRAGELAAAVTAEMGAPVKLAGRAQAPAGFAHFAIAAGALADYSFEENLGTTAVVKEPIGVVGMISPWNWPLNQIACKVAPALATGCTMVLKPSEVAPFSALLLAEVLHEAGVPAGVFNLVNGDGPGVGTLLTQHPDVDMVSFTGSTRAGIEVAKASAPTVKRVAQELGGKSANIVLPDADLSAVVARDAGGMCSNSGQSCNAGTRMLVPADKMDEAAEAAVAGMANLVVGDPNDEATTTGPVASEAQWHKIQELIQSGIDEGATLVTGGVGKPEGLEAGWYVKPTVFANVTNDMRIAREEIFGPVLSILGYADVDDAVRIANDTPYGLSGYVSGSQDAALAVARRIRTGMMHVNGAGPDFNAPFGGYRQSGNGREWGAHGFDDYLETKAIMGATPA
jgi:aldehyde dehydrogenase (NAD+)